MVTGATGFLGSHLVKQLLKEGHRPIILKRRFSKLDRLEEVLPRVRCYSVDEDELQEIFEECGPIDAIIHTATNYGANNVVPSEVLTANTLFPLRLLETASDFKVPLFLNTDSYFNSGDMPYKYKYLPAYCLSKKQLVDWGKQMAESEKIHFVNIKLHHMFGPGDGDSKFTSHVFKSCLQGKELKLTYGEQERDFIYVDDVVSAYMMFLKTPAVQDHWYQNFDLGRGEAVSIRAFVETVHRLTNSSASLHFGALPYREHEIMHAQADINPLRRLDWFPKHTVEQGIHRTVAWYQNNESS